MTENDYHKNAMAKINIALGLFLISFGGIVLFSILFTETTPGKIANLCAGSIITAIGAIMIWFSNRTLKADKKP
ncbi:MAG: hypothetical protein RBU29_14020 [bacterium]|jgi:hypothetical protein|nr:hypothetical protein [bacterium]